VQVIAADYSGEMIIQKGMTLKEDAYGDLDIMRQGKMEIVEDLTRLKSSSALNGFFGSKESSLP
jgi:hypothetical protein